MTNKILALLIFFFVAFSFWPSIYELLNQDKIQPNRHFELIHNYYTDYNFYLSRIREGLEGNLLVTETYTSEPHQGSFVQIFYLALGWVGRYVNVPWDRPGDVYHMARIVFGILLLAATAEFAKKSFSSIFGGRHAEVAHENFYLSSVSLAKLFGFASSSRSRSQSEAKQKFVGSPHGLAFWPILAFLLAVTASSWPILVQVGNSWPAGNAWQSLAGWRFGGYMAWWSVMDSLQRITFIPHLLVGQALIIFLLLMMSDRKRTGSGGNLIFIGILGLLLGLIFPPGLYFLYAILGVLFFLEIFVEKKVTQQNFLPKFIFGLISLPSIIYFLFIMTIYPWQRLVEFDVINPTTFSYLEYFKALGPVFISGLIGGITALIKKEKVMLVPLAWVMAWLSLLFVFQFVPQQSALRYSEVAVQVPLAILSAYLFYLLSRLPKRYLFIRHLAVIIPASVILLGLGTMYSSRLWQKDFIDQKLRASWPLMAHDNYIMYPLKDFVDAMVYLGANSPRSAVVLGLPETGNYIPAYSGNTVYVGHSNTVRAEDKLVVVKKFFSAGLKPEAAQSWLTSNGIRYIVFGPDEMELGHLSDLTKIYPFLKEVYSNPEFIIYSVQ